MKKILSLLVIFVLIFAVSGCKNTADEKTTGIIFLDYFEDYDEYSKQIKNSPYLDEFEFLGKLSKKEFITVSEGTQTFAIIPADTTESVSVYKVNYDEELNKTSNGDLLYNSSKVKPFVIKCNSSDIFSDVKIVLTAKDGTVTEFSPQVSMKDGKVEILTEKKDLIKDLTSYLQISGQTEYTISNNIHTYIISQNEDTLQSKKTLTILDKTSGKLVQNINLTENEWFTKKPIYLVDVSFDGHIDIIVPHSRPASAAFFQAYIWDAEHNKYQYAPRYESIPNIAIDSNNKLLLSHRTADKITSYGMYGYSAKKHDIIEVSSIYWEPQKTSNSMLVKEFEYNNGTEKLIKQFSASAIDSITIDKTDSKIAPYFSNNSIWNFDDEKWDNLVISYNECNY